jgi:uncharacterized protein
MNNQDYTRRKFLSTGAAGLITAGLTSLPLKNVFAGDSLKTEVKKGEIIYRILGKTGIKVPVISMGVMNSDNPGVVEESYKLGVRHFDTAAYYQGGVNEKMVGNVIKKLGVRDKVTIGTKIFTPDMYGDLKPGVTKKKIIDQFDSSLKRLQMDHVDILYLHNVKDNSIMFNEDVQEAFTSIKKSGKARFIGMSTHTYMAKGINEAIKAKIFEVILTAINFTLYDYSDLFAAMTKASEAGIGLVAMKTQAGGPRIPNPDSLKNYSSETVATASLKWALHFDYITTAIPGYDNYEHMRQDFSVASDLAYTEEEEKFLDDNSVKLGFGFCRQCEKCLASCPNGVEIPTLMRTHMYARQYGNFNMARATYNEIPYYKSLDVCGNCESCVAKCSNSVNIPQKISDLKMMYV